MSLATTGGGGGFAGAGAGMAMAHHAGAAGGNAVAIPTQTNFASGATATGVPTSGVAALGADIVDKAHVTAKQSRNRAHLPLAGVDLYASNNSSVVVAHGPPKPTDAAAGTWMAQPIGITSKATSMAVAPLLQATESSHKTLRKWLSRSKPYEAVRAACCVSNDSNKKSKGKTISLGQPQRLLGLRKLDDVSALDRASESSNWTIDTDSAALAPTASTNIGVTLTAGSMDGGAVVPAETNSSSDSDDDHRVVLSVRLHEQKKPLTLLPEDATGLLLHHAQTLVVQAAAASANANASDNNNSSSSSDDQEQAWMDQVTDVPLAVAVPSFRMHDAAMDALNDSVDGGVVIVPRPQAALLGALQPIVVDNNYPGLSKTKKQQEAPKHLLWERLGVVLQAKLQQHKQAVISNPDAQLDEQFLLILVGTLAGVGTEVTAITVNRLQQEQQPACPFEQVEVVANVSRMLDPNDTKHSTAESLIPALLDELETIVDGLLSADADGPSAIVYYADSDAKQNPPKFTRPAAWKDVPIIPTPSSSVAVGTAILGGLAHGRIAKITKKSSTSKKPKLVLASTVSGVAPMAVGVRTSYDAGNTWQTKPIFDWDRRVPAGPYNLEFTASACAARISQNGNTNTTLDEAALLQSTKEMEGAKFIPQRESAALRLRVQVVQQWSRPNNNTNAIVWHPVGPVQSPLVRLDKDEQKIACEAVVMQLALAANGMISCGFEGDRQSVSQATKSARNSTIRYWVGMLFAILFFGGFLFKSWWDEHVLERDTRKLLAYYKHVLPGSIQDGDEHSARYMCYKYRSKKDKLWRGLERKYEQPVLEVDEWDDNTMNKGEEETEETVDMDDDEEESTTSKEDGQEPDL